VLQCMGTTTVVLVQMSQRAPQLRHLLLRINFNGHLEGRERSSNQEDTACDDE
jgi:hypothetical protein